MYQETIDAPNKRSYNLPVIKVNKKTEITSVCSTLYLCHKITIKKNLVSHIQLFCLQFNISYKQNLNLTKIVLVKFPVQVFHFCYLSTFKLFTTDFSSRIFIFPLVDWLNKSDYFSLQNLQDGDKKNRFCERFHVLRKLYLSGRSDEAFVNKCFWWKFCWLKNIFWIKLAQ